MAAAHPMPPCLVRVSAAVLGLLLAACQATPQAASRPAPTSIAHAPTVAGPTGWTTRPGEQAPTLEREPARDYEGTGPWVWTASVSTSWILAGDLGGGRPGLGTWTNGVRLGLGKPCVDCAKLSAYAAYEQRRDFFDGADVLGTGTDRPWGTVHGLGAGLNWFQPLSETWAVVLAGDVSASAEEGADLARGASVSGTFGLGHRILPNLDVGAGVIVLRRFAEEVLVFGGPQFDWGINDTWRLQLEGAQLTLHYRPEASWSAGLSGGFESDRFRLRRGAPGLSQVVTDSRLPVSLWYRTRLRDDMSLEVRVGLEVYRDLIIEDRDGVGLRGYSADPALFFSLRWSMKL